MRLRSPALKVILAAIAAGSLWFYVQRVLVPYQKADAAAHGRTRGKFFSDLYPRWYGARELLLSHRDPHSPQVTRDIQIGFIGRPLDPNRPGDTRDQQAFAYPVYVVFFLAPFIYLPFPLVQTLFTWLFAALLTLTVFLWMRALRWKPSLSTTIAVVLLTLGSFPAAQALKLQQLTVLVSALMAGAVLLLVNARFLSAGVLLALASIKPQLMLPLTGWLMLWTVSDWRARRRFAYGFAGAMAVLLVAAEILLPGWFGEFRRALAEYQIYAGSNSVLDVLVGRVIGKVLAVCIVLLVVITGWRARRAGPGSGEFMFVNATVIAATVVIIPMIAPYNQPLLLPGIFLVLSDWHGAWRKRLSAWFARIAVAVIAWPWLTSFELLVASFFLVPEKVQQSWDLPLRSSLTIPLVVLAVLGLRGLHSRTAPR